MRSRWRYWLTVPLLDVSGCSLIEPSHLANVEWKGIERVVFRTDNSALPMEGDFQEKYTALSLEAKYLIERGIKLVGIDYLSIEKYEPDSTLPSTRPRWEQGW